MESANTCKFKRSARRGLTFIETICAVAMLALVAAALLGAFNSMISQQDRQNHRLAAMELANRLVLQYLDDSDTMPAKGLPIAYANERYRWELEEQPVRLLPALPEVAAERTSASAVSVDRMVAISVRVWLSEESGGSMSYDARVPSAALTRLMDPIALRNPDTTNYLAHSPVKQRELLERFRTIGRTAPAPKPGTPGALAGGSGKPGGSTGKPSGSPSAGGGKPAPIPAKPGTGNPFDPYLRGDRHVPGVNLSPKGKKPS